MGKHDIVSAFVSVTIIDADAFKAFGLVMFKKVAIGHKAFESES